MPLHYKRRRSGTDSAAFVSLAFWGEEADSGNHPSAPRAGFLCGRGGGGGGQKKRQTTLKKEQEKKNKKMASTVRKRGVIQTKTANKRIKIRKGMLVNRLGRIDKKSEINGTTRNNKQQRSKRKDQKRSNLQGLRKV